jgi:hypothetical protein
VSSPPHVVAACPASLLAQAARAARTGGAWRKRAAPAAAAACVGREGRRGGQRRAFRFLPASRSVIFYNHGRAGEAPTVLGSWPCLPASACLSAARGVSSLFARILTAPSLLAVFFLVPRRTPKRSPFTLLLLLASEDALPTNNQLRRCVICKTVYALFCSGRSKRRTSKELRRLCFIPMSLWYYLRLAAVVSWKNYAKFLA